MNSFDYKLSEIWNNIHPTEKIPPERFWEICRELSCHRILQFDRGTVGTMSLGPFKIATSLDKDKEKILTIFAENIFPIFVTETINLTFNEAYLLYFIPMFKILIYILDNSFLIESPLQWSILIYVKQANEKNYYPTISEIINAFNDRWNIMDIEYSINSLFEIENYLGSSKAILNIDNHQRLHSLV
ncbi:MAG: hypothetical protein ACI4N4_01915 [Candidatus Fimenecus sp.]